MLDNIIATATEGDHLVIVLEQLSPDLDVVLDTILSFVDAGLRLHLISIREEDIIGPIDLDTISIGIHEIGDINFCIGA